jgi:radical SAM superfamily enzyme YgiQ (UPF0313 family)
VRVHLITAESPESRRLRRGRLIQFPQLTMPLIAALTPPGHVVTHTDEIVEPVRFDVPADLVGITAPTPSALHAYGLAREFRRRGVPVVLGGPHATALPEEAARHASAVVVGEAEDTWPRVLFDAARGELEPVYVSSRTAPLAGMPAPRWDLIRGRRYGKSVTIATRGCPHRCDYCTIPLLYGPGTVRYRPIDEVVREVAASPTRAVVFWDDNIGANLRYAKELFRALTPLRKWWTSQCTANAVRDEELVALAARSGCKALFLGLESISQESLQGTNKAHNRVADYRRLIASLHRHGIAVHLGIMFGFDQDDTGIFRRTADFLDEARVDVATVSMVVPMPGTPTFRRLHAEGRILTTDWSRYDGKRHCVFEPARMSPAELEAGTEWVARRFYSPRSIARRLAGSRAGVWWNLPRNVGYMIADRLNAGPAWDPGRARARRTTDPAAAAAGDNRPLSMPSRS